MVNARKISIERTRKEETLFIIGFVSLSGNKDINFGSFAKSCPVQKKTWFFFFKKCNLIYISLSIGLKTEIKLPHANI